MAKLSGWHVCRYTIFIGSYDYPETKTKHSNKALLVD